MRDTVEVVVGISAVLSFTAAFAMAFRPNDFRRHRSRDAKPGRPSRTPAAYLHSHVVLPPDYTPTASKPRWPRTPRSDVPEGR